MRVLSQNIRVMRKKADLTQQELADRLRVNRGVITSYEQNRATPPLKVILKLSEVLKTNLDSLINQDLRKEDPKKGSYSKETEILAITVDSQGKENVDLVNQQASAGYIIGYHDEEFIKDLPKINLPFLAKNKTYRAFEITGDSMLPVQPNSIIVGEFIESIKDLKKGDCCVLVTEDGIVFKRAYPFLEIGKVFLVSDNTLFKPYLLDANSILQIWRKKKIIVDDVDTVHDVKGNQLADMVLHMQDQVSKLKKR
jgi:transcriptional regulator with XRE-family HTH domain